MIALVPVARLFLERGLMVLVQSTLLLGLGLVIGWFWRQRGPNHVSFVLRLTLVSTAVLWLCAMIFHLSPGGLIAIHLPAMPNKLVAAPAAQANPPQMPMVPDLLAAVHSSHSPVERKKSTIRHQIAIKPPLPLISHTQNISPVQTAPTIALSPIARAEILLTAVWLIGTVILILRILFGQLFLWQLSRVARPADSDVLNVLADLCHSQRMSPPQVRTSPRVHSPFLVGIRRRVIYLPDTTFDSETLRAVLAHELAHLARHDCLWKLFGQIMGCLLWPQPLLWLLLRRAEEASEEDCDFAVLSQDCTPAVYAALLLDLAKRFTPGQRHHVLSTGIVPHQSALSRRIQTILDRRLSMRSLSRRTQFSLTAVLAAAAFSSLFLVSTHAAPPIHFSIFDTQKQLAEKSMINMHQMILGVQQYSQDYDDVYPPARKWGTVIAPYLRPKDAVTFSQIQYSKELHHDPLAPEAQAYGYAFNQGLAYKHTIRVIDPAQTVALFETTKDEFNAADAGQSLARPGRINDGNYYAFADGHIQWMSDSRAPSFKPNFSPQHMTQRGMYDSHPTYDAIQQLSRTRAGFGILTGRVIDSKGQPARNVGIILSRLGQNSGKFGTNTQNDGTFYLSPSVAGTFALSLYPDHTEQNKITIKKQIAVIEGKTTHISDIVVPQINSDQTAEALAEQAKAEAERDSKMQSLDPKQLAEIDAHKQHALNTLQQQLAEIAAKDASSASLSERIAALQADKASGNKGANSLSQDQIKALQMLQDSLKDNQDGSKKQYDALMKQLGSADTFPWKKLEGQDGTKKDYDALMKQLAVSGTFPLKLQYAPLAGLTQQQGDLRNQLVAAQKHQANLSAIIAQLSITNQMIQNLQEQLLQEQKELQKLQETQPAKSTTATKPSPIDYSIRALQEQTKNLQQEQTQEILQEQKELDKLRQAQSGSGK